MNNTISQFPKEDVAPAEKAKREWLLKYAKAAHAEVLSRPAGTIGYPSRAQYRLNRQYSHAEQDVTALAEEISAAKKGAGDDRTGISELFFKPIPVYSTLMRVNVEYVDKQMFDVHIDPIDPTAAAELADAKAMLKSKVALRTEAQRVGASELLNTPALIPNPGEPDDMEGAEMATTNMRHRSAEEAELVSEHVLSQSDIDSLRTAGIEDTMDCGVIVGRDYVADDLPMVRGIDPADLFLSWCRKPDLSDRRYVGELMRLHPTMIKELAGEQVSEEQLQKAYSATRTSQTYVQWYNEASVEVLDLEIITNDTIYKETRTDKYGNVKFGNSAPGKKVYNGEQVVKKIIGLYRCKWVVGTDIIFDYGPAKVTKRPPGDKARAIDSFHIAGIGIRDMRAVSRTQKLIPLIDAMHRAWFRWQHALSVAVPRGYAIDVAALKHLEQTEGASFNSERVIRDFIKTGVLVFTSEGKDKGEAVGPPIKEIQTGTGAELQEFMNSFAQIREMMRMSLGLNDVTDASTPDQKLLNGVASMAASSSNNAVADLRKAVRRWMLSIVESVILRAQVLIKAGRGGAITKALGADTTQVLSDSPTLDRYTMGFRIEERPTAEEQQILNSRIEMALQSGQLNIADTLTLSNIRNQKTKARELDYRIRKNEKKRAEEADRQQQMNAQVQQQSAQQTAELAQQTLRLEYALKLQLAREEKDKELEIVNAAGQWRVEERRYEASGRKEAAAVQAAQRDTANVRDTSVALAKEGLMEQAANVQTDPLMTDSIEKARAMIEGPSPFEAQLQQVMNSPTQPLTAGGQQMRFTPPPDSPDEQDPFEAMGFTGGGMEGEEGMDMEEDMEPEGVWGEDPTAIEEVPEDFEEGDFSA